LVEKLSAAGVTTVEALADMTPEQLEAIEGIGPKTVEKISLAVNNYFSALEAGEAAADAEAGAAEAPAEEGAVEVPAEGASPEASAEAQPVPADEAAADSAEAVELPSEEEPADNAAETEKSGEEQTPSEEEQQK